MEPTPDTLEAKSTREQETRRLERNRFHSLTTDRPSADELEPDSVYQTGSLSLKRAKWRAHARAAAPRKCDKRAPHNRPLLESECLRFGQTHCRKPRHALFEARCRDRAALTLLEGRQPEYHPCGSSSRLQRDDIFESVRDREVCEFAGLRVGR